MNDMEISYLGHSSFRIKTKTATVVTDPFAPEMTGFRFPKVEADVVTISHNHKDHNNALLVEGSPFEISLPGEYETKGISVFGYSSFHDNKSGAERGKNTIFLIEAEGLRICHLGDLGGIPSEEILEEISGADVLMIPVGGGGAVLDAKQAAEVIKQAEPLYVLPMHFKTDEHNENFAEFSPVQSFLKEMGVDQPEKLDKLSLSKDKLPEEVKIVLLERKS